MGGNVINVPRTGQQIVAVGSRGSGKTELQCCLVNLAPAERKFIIDTQDSLEADFAGFKKITTPQALSWKMKMFKKIRYVPKNEYRNRATWNYVLDTIANSSSKSKPRPIDLYIDEIYHLGIGMSFPTSLPILCSTARQKRIGIYISTQRPSLIPISVLSEATKIYVFYLSYLEDLKKVGKFSKIGDLPLRLREMELDHAFVEVDGQSGTYRIMPPLNLKSVKERINANSRRN